MIVAAKALGLHNVQVEAQAWRYLDKNGEKSKQVNGICVNDRSNDSSKRP
jgi:hypothetical protein